MHHPPLPIPDAGSPEPRRETGPPRYRMPADLDPDGKLPTLSVAAARRLASDIRYWLISLGKDEDLP